MASIGATDRLDEIRICGRYLLFFRVCAMKNASFSVAACFAGDVVIASGTVSYLGPFTADYRTRIANGWVQVRHSSLSIMDVEQGTYA